MSNLGDALITCEQDARIIPLKIWVVWITLLTISTVIERLLFSMQYGMSKIFR